MALPMGNINADEVCLAARQQINQAAMKHLDVRLNLEMSDIRLKANGLFRAAFRKQEEEMNFVRDELEAVIERQQQMIETNSEMRQTVNDLMKVLKDLSLGSQKGGNQFNSPLKSTETCSEEDMQTATPRSGRPFSFDDDESATTSQTSPFPKSRACTPLGEEVAVNNDSDVVSPAMTMPSLPPAFPPLFLPTFPLERPLAFLPWVSDPDGRLISFTLRKAHGGLLGMELSEADDGRALRVELIMPAGAIPSWNQLCLNNPLTAHKAVFAGDKIVGVNGIAHASVGMLNELRETDLLRLTVVRCSPTGELGSSFPF